MFFVTGDIHREWNRFGFQSFPEGRQLGREDIVFVTGDFGIWENSKDERYWMDWLAKRPFTICFVSGNHENYDILDALPVELWNGGKVNRIRENVLHLCRGQVFVIDGQSFFTFGGASSHDISGGILEPDDVNFKEKKKKLNKEGIWYRIHHQTWWERELPSEAEMEEGRQNLERCGWKVDVVLTHCASNTVQELLGCDYGRDCLTDYFEEIRERLDYRLWLFGHYHDNRKVTNKDILLYEQIVQLPKIS
ncbi:MAG: metallophosphoesterase [bacterium]|nr:metallophosphoesterase [bacterium]